MLAGPTAKLYIVHDVLLQSSGGSLSDLLLQMAILFVLSRDLSPCSTEAGCLFHALLLNPLIPNHTAHVLSDSQCSACHLACLWCADARVCMWQWTSRRLHQQSSSWKPPWQLSVRRAHKHRTFWAPGLPPPASTASFPWQPRQLPSRYCALS